MGISIWQLLLVLVIVFVVFGAGKLPRVMGDVGKGVRNLREGLKDGDGDDKEKDESPKELPKESAEKGTQTIIEPEKEKSDS